MSIIGPPSERPTLRTDARLAAAFLRCTPGFASLVMSWTGRTAWAAGFLVLAVWADAAAGVIARRRKWPARPEHVHLDALVDLTCFVWAPAQFFAVVDPSIPVLSAILLFAFVGIYRMARFRAEGLMDGKYRGLPVTYNGYLIPLAALAAKHAGPSWDTEIRVAALVLAAALMVSSKLRIPEF